MTGMLKKCVVGLVAIQSLSGAVEGFAEEKQKIHVLEDVVVTASKIDDSYQTGDVDLEETPSFYSQIKRESFEGKVEDIAEVLEKEAGIQVRKTGGLGSFSAISLRGSTSEQVMVYMDGVLLNDSNYGGIDLSNISLSDVESIEVYRGVTPLNFGKASIGGVVNITTRRSKETFNGSVRAGVGSFDTRQLSAFVNQKPGRWDYVLSGDYLASKNDYWILNPNQTPYNPYDDKWEEMNNNAFRQTAFLGKFGYDFSQDSRFDFSNQFFSKEQSLPGWQNLESTGTGFDTRRNTAIMKFTRDNVGACNMSANLDYTWKEEEYDDRSSSVGLSMGEGGGQHNLYVTNALGGHYYLEAMGDWNILSVMADLRFEAYSQEDLFHLERAPLESTRGTFSLGVQDTLLLLDQRLSFTPALRYYHVRNELLSAAGPTDPGSGEVQEPAQLPSETEDKDYVSPQMGIKYRAADWLVLKSNIARYTREPAFYELFGDRGWMTGNPSLDAEEGVNFDAGFSINRDVDNAYIQRLSWDAAYFQSHVEDLITVVFNAQGFGRYANIGKAEIKGIETDFRVDFLAYFRLIANATWQDPVNMSDSVDQKGKILPGRYTEAYFGRIEAKAAGVKLYLEYVKEVGMKYASTNLTAPGDQPWTGSPDKKETNLGASWLWEPFLVTFEAKNIRNSRYQSFWGYPLPGRSFYLTVKYNF